MKLKTTHQRTNGTQSMVMKDGNIPNWIKENPQFMYGRSSGAYNEDSQRITEVINYEYLK